MRAAAPAARKPTCLSRPVIGADGEFWKCGSLRSEGRICVNPCEFNVIQRGIPHPLGQDPDAGSRSCDALKSCQKNRPIDTSLSVYDLVRQPHKHGHKYKG